MAMKDWTFQRRAAMMIRDESHVRLPAGSEFKQWGFPRLRNRRVGDYAPLPTPSGGEARVHNVTG